MLEAMRIAAIMLCLLAAPAFAQTKTPNADEILANVQKFYAQPTQLSAQFTQNVTYKAYGMSKPSKGHLWVKKPSSFRFDYEVTKNKKTKTAKTFTFDGTTLWFIDIGGKKIYEHAVQQGAALPAAVSFLTGAATLSKDFTIALTTKSGYGAKGTLVLEMTPKQANAGVTKLFFVVDPSDWHINESVVIESNGDTNDFHFYAPDVKTEVKASLFVVDPKKLGYKVELVK
jgi:outer membrane lipoprotein carrier protein